MNPLIQYAIPVKGLRNGTHQFTFHIDREFFAQFESTPVTDGKIDMKLVLDKRPDMLVLEFAFAGTVKTECDRCLAQIDLPVADNQRLLVKFSEEKEAEDADVIFVSPELQQLNVATYAYEYVILSIPIFQVYDCKNDPNRVCNEEMLQYIQNRDEEDEAAPNPIWEELKKLNQNDN
jgi:uncharacterized protein